VVQASALLQIDDSTSMRELAARLGGHASNATGIAGRLAPRAWSNGMNTPTAGE